MRKIGYSVKAILKHRVSLVVFCILLIFNLFAMVELIRENQSETVDQKILEYRMEIYSMESSINNRISLDLQGNYTDQEKKYLTNYHNYLLWQIDQVKYEWNALKQGEDIQQLSIIHGLLGNLVYLDYVVDESIGNDFAENVFAEELEKYDDKIHYSELPFEPETLYLMPYLNDYLTREDKKSQYETTMWSVKYYFSLLGTNTPDLSLDSISPWSFLVRQIGYESFYSYLIIPLAILFSAVYLYDTSRKQSLKLLLVQGSDRKFVVLNQIVSLTISYGILLFISLFIPMMMLGMLNGYQGLNLPMLVDEQGLKSFVMYEHTDSYGVFHLSTYPASYLITTQEGYNPIPSTMGFMPLWQVLILTASLSILKISVAISLGTMSIFCLRKRWQSFGLLTVFLFAYLYFQNQAQNVYSRLNIFDIRSSLATLQGCYQTTFLNAIVLCLAAIVIINGLNIVLFKRFDYSE